MTPDDRHAGEIRYWPSLATQEPGWHYATAADGGKSLHVDLPRASFDVSLKDALWAIEFLAQRRFEMDDDLPLTPYGRSTESHYRADAYTFEPLPQSQTAIVWSRLPGIGWVHLHLDANEIRQMAEDLLALAGPRVEPSRGQ